MHKSSQIEAPTADIHLGLVHILKLALLGVEGAKLHVHTISFSEDFQAHSALCTYGSSDITCACTLLHASSPNEHAGKQGFTVEIVTLD